MSTQEVAEVREFVVECIEAAGGAVDAHNHVAEALLPEELEPVFGGRPLVPIAFDGDTLEEHPDAELVTVGTPVLDALIDYAGRHGTASAGVIETDRLRKKGFLETVQSELTFVGCRLRHDERDQESRWAAYAVFHFRVSLVSDERRERIAVVPVNLWSNRPAPDLAEELPHLSIGSERRWLIPEAARVPAAEGYATACAFVEEEVRRLQEIYQARVLRRLEVDVARTTEYYEAIAAELRLRVEREGDDPQSRPALEQKIAATLAEKERKLHEIAEKYRLRATVRLVAARLLWQPKVFGRFLVDRKQVTRELTLAYDPVLERLELPACEGCGRPARRLTISGDRLVCLDCGAGK